MIRLLTGGEDRRMPMRDPLTISPEEDEEQMIMRRLRNSCDELRRGYRSGSVVFGSESSPISRNVR